MKDAANEHADAPARAVLLSLLAPEKLRLSMALAITLAAALVELLPYGMLSHTIEAALSQRADAEYLFRMAGLLAMAILGKYVLYSLAYYFSHVAAYGLLASIRQTLVRRLAVAPLPWLQQNSSGQLKKIVLQDVERLEQFIAHHTVECLAAISSPVLVSLVLVWIDWRLAAAALLTVPLAALAQLILMRGLGPLFDEYNRAIGELNGATIEYVRNAPVTKAFCQNARSFRRMTDLLQRYHDLIAAVTRRTVPGWSAFMVLLGANIVFLLPTSLWLHRQGAITLPDAVLAVMLGSGMLKPLFKVAHFSSEIREITAGARRLAPILRFRPSPPPNEQRPPASTEITFENVSFSYGDRPVLHDVGFTLRPGSVTALVGPSGAGKSTIAHLLSGLMEPDAGRICLGGVALSELDDELRSRLIAVAAQDAFLFHGTLLDNLRLARPEAGEDMVRRAARIAQAEEFITALPDGYQTTVGERGTRLSGGERQRATIARALLGDTPILVLDEATAFADSRTERRFYQALRDACPDKTLLVIAHRLRAIEQADQILVLANGRLVDCGRHDELASRCPLYRGLWQRQFDSESWSIRPDAVPCPTGLKEG